MLWATAAALPPPWLRAIGFYRRQRLSTLALLPVCPCSSCAPLSVDLFEARRDPSVAVARRPEAIHVYGVDLMSTGDILKYFADYGGWCGRGTCMQALPARLPARLLVCLFDVMAFWLGAAMAQVRHRDSALPWRAAYSLPAAGPQFVEWINDSSANVLFADPGTAKRAVAGMGQALPPDEAPEQMGE